MEAGRRCRRPRTRGRRRRSPDSGSGAGRSVDGWTRRAPCVAARGCNRAPASHAASEKQRRSQKRHIRQSAVHKNVNIREHRACRDAASARSQKRHIADQPRPAVFRDRVPPLRAHRIETPSTVSAHAFTQTPKQRPDAKEQQRARAPHPHQSHSSLPSPSPCPPSHRPGALIIGGSTSVLPLAQKLASAYHKAYPHDPRAESQRRSVGHRHQGRRQRPLRHRRLLARPDQGRRPERPRVHEDRARRRVRDHQHRQPDLEPLTGNGRRDLHRAHPRLERSPRREDQRADRPVRPRRRLRYPGRLPAHLPRRNPEDLAERDRRDLQRPRAARGRKATNRRSASCPSHTPAGQRRRLPGHPLQPAQRQVRPVRRRA